MSPFSLIKIIIPFLWELTVGKRSLKSALISARRQLFVFAIVALSLLTNFVTVPKVYQNAMDTYKNKNLVKECEATKASIAKLQEENVVLKKAIAAESKKEKQLSPFSNDMINNLDSEARQFK